MRYIDGETGLEKEKAKKIKERLRTLEGENNLLRNRITLLELENKQLREQLKLLETLQALIDQLRSDLGDEQQKRQQLETKITQLELNLQEVLAQTNPLVSLR